MNCRALFVLLLYNTLHSHTQYISTGPHFTRRALTSSVPGSKGSIRQTRLSRVHQWSAGLLFYVDLTGFSFSVPIPLAPSACCSFFPASCPTSALTSALALIPVPPLPLPSLLALLYGS